MRQIGYGVTCAQCGHQRSYTTRIQAEADAQAHYRATGHTVSSHTESDDHEEEE